MSEVNQKAQAVVNESLKTDALWDMLEQETMRVMSAFIFGSKGDDHLEMCTYIGMILFQKVGTVDKKYRMQLIIDDI